MVPKYAEFYLYIPLIAALMLHFIVCDKKIIAMHKKLEKNRLIRKRNVFLGFRKVQIQTRCLFWRGVRSLAVERGYGKAVSGKAKHVLFSKMEEALATEISFDKVRRCQRAHSCLRFIGFRTPSLSYQLNHTRQEHQLGGHKSAASVVPSVSPARSQAPADLKPTIGSLTDDLLVQKIS